MRKHAKIFGVVATAVAIGFAASLVLAQIYTTFPRDQSGNIAPPNFFGGSGGTWTPVSNSDPLPVTTGTTTSTTDPQGWGKQFFASNQVGGEQGACILVTADYIICKEPAGTTNSILSTNRGRTWRIFSGDLIGNGVHTAGISLGGGTLLMTGGSPETNTRKSVNSGSSWSTVSTPPPDTNSLSRIEGLAVNGNTVIAVGKDGDNINGDPRIWRSSNLGEDWATVHTETVTGMCSFGVVRFITGTTWLTLISGWNHSNGVSCNATTEIGKVFRSTDDGATWALFSTDLRTVGCDDRCVGPFVARTLAGARTLLAGNSDTLFRSLDDGATWTPVFTKASLPEFVNVLDVGSGIWLALAVRSSGREVWRSLDGGTTWELVFGDTESTSISVSPDYYFLGDSTTGTVLINNNASAAQVAIWYSQAVPTGQVRTAKAFTLSALAKTCGTTVSILSGALSVKRDVVVRNVGAGPIFLGGLGVDVANGYRVDVGEAIVFDNYEGDVRCIASASQSVRVMEVRD